MRNISLFLLGGFILLSACDSAPKVEISGELKQWHNVTLTFNGPQTSEYDQLNPFLDYRLNVTFTRGENQYVVPGYFAADGNAGESGAVSGSIWRIHFCPDAEGEWSYKVSFRTGKTIAVSDDPEAGVPVELDGHTGFFTVEPTDKSGRDFRAKGKLEYVGEHYLRFAGTGEYFLKGGADSPENFLGYHEFDGTWSGPGLGERPGDNIKSPNLHTYESHIKDWHEGDPVWQSDKGKGIIGALNYLASEGMNSVYMLTMNVMGDGDDVWPWNSRNERYRFDCSKLDQWEIVFSHMDSQGIMLHFVIQEQENELLLDVGFTEVQRKLYFRELVARFAHHLAITWNMGEENGPSNWKPNSQTDRQRIDMATYLKKTNPYNDLVVLHTHSNPDHRYDIMSELLGEPSYDGISMQLAWLFRTHDETKKWNELSADSNKKWIVCLDEIGPASTGVKPDADDPDHFDIRAHCLWANLMAGGAGVEWYFGYEYPHADLDCEDWRSRDLMWDQTRYALEFFHKYLPFQEMKSLDDLTDADNDFCFANPGEIYAVYLPEGGSGTIDLRTAEGTLKVQWYNPRTGGDLAIGSVSEIEAGRNSSFGSPAEDSPGDWVVLISRNK
jgi:hypothetical protein